VERNGNQPRLRAQLIDGEVFLHGLDLQKNLAPLLCGRRWRLARTVSSSLTPVTAGSTSARTACSMAGLKGIHARLAERLKPLLEANGWTVFLTRTSDVYVTNANRVVFATAHHADLFISCISIRLQTAMKSLRPGNYCFTPPECPQPSREDMPILGMKNCRATTLIPRIYNLRKGAERLAARRRHGRPGRAPCAIHRGSTRQKCPAVLIEGGFLSSAAEAGKIESAAYRQKLAEAVATALK